MLFDPTQVAKNSSPVTADRVLSVSDLAQELYNSSPSKVTLTIPASVMTRNHWVDVCPDTASITITPAAGVLLNGSTSSISVPIGGLGNLFWRSVNEVRYRGSQVVVTGSYLDLAGNGTSLDVGNGQLLAIY